MLTKILGNKIVVRVSLVLALGNLLWWALFQTSPYPHDADGWRGQSKWIAASAVPSRWNKQSLPPGAIGFDERVPVHKGQAAQGKSLFAEPNLEIKLHIGESVALDDFHFKNSGSLPVPKAESQQKTSLPK